MALCYLAWLNYDKTSSANAIIHTQIPNKQSKQFLFKFMSVWY